MLCVIVVLSFMDTALRDHRIELVRASSQELTIRIKDVSLSDEGQYTCSLFTMPVKTTKAFLTVLGEILVGVSACVFVMSNFQPTVALWENVCGWTSSENTGVPARPEITGITKPATEGDMITLTCMTTGSKPAARIQWLRNDKEVQGKRAVRCGWSVVSSAARMSSHSAAAFFFLHCSFSLGFTGATSTGWLSACTVLLLSLELAQISLGCIGTSTQQTCSLWDHYKALWFYCMALCFHWEIRAAWSNLKMSAKVFFASFQNNNCLL